MTAPRDIPVSLTVVHPHAAGIDDHSDMHMVRVPPECAPGGNVRPFGANTCDLLAIADWLGGRYGVDNRPGGVRAVRMRRPNWPSSTS